MQTSDGPQRQKRARGASGEAEGMSPEEQALVHNCWRFLNAARRVDTGQLPVRGEGGASYSALESYLLLAHTVTQAGLFWSMKVPFGDAGVGFHFPGAERIDDVPQVEWDEFAGCALALQCRLAEELGR